MFKLLVVVLALICSVSAKPAVVAYSAPLVAAAAPAGLVTATSSQYIARNYNGIAAAPIVAAPALAAPAALQAAPVAAAAYTAPAYYPYSYTAVL